MFNLEKFFKDSKRIKMTKEEKLALLNYLRVKMAAEPAARLVSRPVRNPLPVSHNQIWSTNKFKLIFTKPMPIAIILALLIGGGASAAAQHALPGDLLYPIKVNVNENIRSWLAVSDESQANLDTTLAGTRLDEAEKLAADNRLDDTARASLEANFQKHADQVKTEIDKLEAKDTPQALEVVSNLQASLDAHAKILQNLETSLDGNVAPKLEKIKILVEDDKDKINEDRVNSEGKIKAESGPDTQTAAEGKLKAVENNLAEVKAFIDRHSDRFDANTKTKAEVQLKLAQDTLAQGQAKLDAKAFGEAFSLFQEAQSQLQEVKLILTAKVDLEDENPSPTPTPSSTATVSPSPTPTSPSASTPIKAHEEEDEHLKAGGRIRIDL